MSHRGDPTFGECPGLFSELAEFAQIDDRGDQDSGKKKNLLVLNGRSSGAGYWME